MQKINKINQYLLEKYPTVWNTRIVWMLLASAVLHIFFFIVGYISHADPASLQKMNVKDDYFREGMIFIHLIISVLMMVGWLIMMFKNNAFKNFYPSSKGKLFLQFVQYFIIIFAGTTFYFSYMTGFKLFIKNKYPDQEMTENINVINKANAFLSQDLEHYTLDNRTFPKFYDLYCETDINKIDRNQKYFVYYNRVYQFYNLYSKTVYKKDKYGDFLFPSGETKKNLAYEENKKGSATYYFKKDVVDMSSYINTTDLTYYNFSDVFYNDDDSGKDYLRMQYSGEEPYDGYNQMLKDSYKKKRFEINRFTTELLNKKNPAEIEKLLKSFLDISKKFGINNNLDSKSWVKMIYHPNDFNVRYFIKKYKPVPGEEYDVNNPPMDEDGNYVYTEAVTDSVAAVVDGEVVNDSVQIRDFNPDIDNQLSPAEYFKNNTTDYYYYSDNLQNLLNNVVIIKSTDFFSENIHIYIWIAFFLATIIFSFRITGLKSLIFSVISAGVLFLAVVLVTVLFSASSGRNGIEFFVSYFVFFIGLAILLLPIVMMKSLKKLIASILINISLNGFVLFVFLIFFIINIHQEESCEQINIMSYDCPTIIKTLGFNLSYIILFCGFVFMYLYTSVLHKWKAMPN
ncbi:hypothetical protein [Candidatus Chryseobacterium massiliense]|uniref:Uncharacterized protein n=1 Tax=Candidatus Chryseobacterium massiliense TaxID=204089 RepID=A0A3D9AHQ3_9FLAO|nr:hypothetical protein [Candidatus Chryseobacterium massiliae]REC40883.1 hypothetical protein DRF68_19440 [Candidatus Chryseobacterium massiliae]